MHFAPETVRFERAFDVEDVTPGCIWSYAMPKTTPTGVVGRAERSKRGRRPHDGRYFGG